MAVGTAVSLVAYLAEETVAMSAVVWAAWKDDSTVAEKVASSAA